MTIETAPRTAEATPEEPKKFFGMTLTPKPKSGGGGRASATMPLVVGGAPRANLLPPEIVLKRKQLKTRRSLRVGVLIVGLAVVAGCVGSIGISTAAQVQLGMTQQQQQQLVNEQLQFAEVKGLQDTIASIKAGEQVGASTEIQWREYFIELQKTLPAGVTIDTFSIDSATPMAAYAQGTGPLQGARVAGINFTALSSTLPTIPDWLRGMASLPGFVDATPGSVKLENGVYKSQISMHINTDAFSLRFDPATIAAAEAEAQAAADAAADTTDTDSETEGN